MASTMLSALLASLAVAATTAGSARAAVTPPAECDVLPPFLLTDFGWFNSTHNLDCVRGPDVGDGTTCFNTTADGHTFTCDPAAGPCGVCGVPACATGLPDTPLGYGPPDWVRIVVAAADGSASYGCHQTNPALVHRYEVGEGWVNCGGAGTYVHFYGDSTAAAAAAAAAAEGPAGHVDWAPLTPAFRCLNGSRIWPQAAGDFALSCVHDAGGNATCSTVLPVALPLVGYRIE